jgi:hypothetical protein
MPKGLITTIWIFWVVVIWFFSMVTHGVALDHGGIDWLVKLLVYSD